MSRYSYKVEKRMADLRRFGSYADYWDINLTTSDLREIFHLSNSMIHNWVKCDGLKCDMHGQTQMGRAHFKWDDVATFVEEVHPERKYLADQFETKMERWDSNLLETMKGEIYFDDGIMVHLV